jgi:hypothetical protein
MHGSQQLIIDPCYFFYICVLKCSDKCVVWLLTSCMPARPISDTYKALNIMK